MPYTANIKKFISDFRKAGKARDIQLELANHIRMKRKYREKMHTKLRKLVDFVSHYYLLDL